MSAGGRNLPDHSQRNKSLDYLRGVMATSIMVYHYSYWSNAHVDAGTVLGKLGIYGVAIFYILSGLTLCIVYKNFLTTDFRSILAFFVKRIFRIFPLLWLAITGTILLSTDKVGWKLCFLNYSGLFGFYHIGGYLAVGQWSIGNELVFYLFFPLFLLLLKWRPTLFFLLLSLSIIAVVYFAFHVLNVNDNLAPQWKYYINPFNQLAFFAVGVLIGYTGQRVNQGKYKNLTGAVLAAGILAFAFYPVSGDSIQIVTGFNRVFFLCISSLVCFCVYHQRPALPGVPDRVLAILGEASYSIYLLHPLVYTLMVKFNPKLTWLRASYIPWISGVITILVSYVVYKRLELPFIRYGKKLAALLGGDRRQKTDKEMEPVAFSSIKSQ